MASVLNINKISYTWLLKDIYIYMYVIIISVSYVLCVKQALVIMSEFMTD